MTITTMGSRIEMGLFKVSNSDKESASSDVKKGAGVHLNAAFYVKLASILNSHFDLSLLVNTASGSGWERVLSIVEPDALSDLNTINLIITSVGGKIKPAQAEAISKVVEIECIKFGKVQYRQGSSFPYIGGRRSNISTRINGADMKDKVSGYVYPITTYNIIIM